MYVIFLEFQVTIEGRQLAVPGVGMQWCTEDSVTAGGGEVTFIKRVEDVALRHYSIAGYPEGLYFYYIPYYPY